MTITRTLALCIAVALPAPALAQVSTPRDAAQAMMQAVDNRDADAVAALYAPDSLVMGPGSVPLTGRSAIRDAWARNFQNGYTRLEVADPRVEQGTDRAAMVFYWRATIQPAGQQEGQYLVGRFMLYLTRTDAGWLISADMWHRPEN